MIDYQKINSESVDRWCESGWIWGIPISHEEFMGVSNGEWKIFLTPTKPVPRNWFPNLKGKKVLGLASGGGQQMPIIAALGANCTVLDYSDKQLESERIVAEREGYSINIVKADMTKPLPFGADEFDLIVHPVSNCYIREVNPIWKECYRILKKGGIMMSGLDIGINYIVDEKEEKIVHSLPFDPLSDENLMRELQNSNEGIQFSHTLTEQIQGQLEAGFSLISLYEDTNGEGRLHELNIPSFIATLSMKG